MGERAKQILLSKMAEDYNLEAIQSICNALRAANAKDAVAQVVGKLTKRMRLSIQSIYLLARSGNEGFEDDAVAILRGVYDAHLQALHAIQLGNPEAATYDDFYYVDRARMVDVLTRLNNEGINFAAQILNHPARAEREPIYEKEFRRVREKFIDHRHAKKLSLESPISINELRSHWYAGTLKSIAKQQAPTYELEYDFVMHQLCGILHKSSYGLNSKAFDGSIVVVYGWHFYYRVMYAVASFYDLRLDEAIVNRFLRPSTRPIYQLLDDGPGDSGKKK